MTLQEQVDLLFLAHEGKKLFLKFAAEKDAKILSLESENQRLKEELELSKQEIKHLKESSKHPF